MLNNPFHNDSELELKYQDSALSFAKHQLPALLYLVYSDKGTFYYSKNQIHTALKYFLLANKDTFHPSASMKNEIQYNIAEIKNSQGNYPEALAIFRKCEKQARLLQLPKYYRFLRGLAEVHHRMGNLEESDRWVICG